MGDEKRLCLSVINHLGGGEGEGGPAVMAANGFLLSMRATVVIDGWHVDLAASLNQRPFIYLPVLPRRALSPPPLLSLLHPARN